MGNTMVSDAGRGQDTTAGVTAGPVPCSLKVTACPCQITLGLVFSCMTWDVGLCALGSPLEVIIARFCGFQVSGMRRKAE